MTTKKTPGERAYDAFYEGYPVAFGHWTKVDSQTRKRWEMAARGVRKTKPAVPEPKRYVFHVSLEDWKRVKVSVRRLLVQGAGNKLRYYSEDGKQRCYPTWVYNTRRKAIREFIKRQERQARDNAGRVVRAKKLITLAKSL